METIYDGAMTGNALRQCITIDPPKTKGHIKIEYNMTSIIHVWQRRSWLLATTSDQPL